MLRLTHACLSRGLAALALVFLVSCGRNETPTTAAPAAANTPAASSSTSATPNSPATPPNPKVPAGAKSSGGKIAAIETDKGTIELELFQDAAPKAVENFRLLAEHGYYDGLTFHRVVRGFMIQGGDPMGDGRGGMSAWGGTFPDEINRGSELYRGGYKRGMIAMANRGPNTNTSQFFILHQDYPLPPSYVIFGKVIRGMEVVDALMASPTRMGTDGDMSAPLTPIVMKKVTIKK